MESNGEVAPVNQIDTRDARGDGGKSRRDIAAEKVGVFFGRGNGEPQRSQIFAVAELRRVNAARINCRASCRQLSPPTRHEKRIAASVQIAFVINDVIIAVEFRIRIDQIGSLAARNITVKPVDINVESGGRRRVVNAATDEIFPRRKLHGDFGRVEPAILQCGSVLSCRPARAIQESISVFRAASVNSSGAAVRISLKAFRSTR